jgi:Holliday junction resolvase RusA-like endonuclease
MNTQANTHSKMQLAGFARSDYAIKTKKVWTGSARVNEVRINIKRTTSEADIKNLLNANLGVVAYYDDGQFAELLVSTVQKDAGRLTTVRRYSDGRAPEWTWPEGDSNNWRG